MFQNYNPLFQRTVFKEFVAKQEQPKIQLAYQKFATHFGDSAVQANLLVAKEEQYQEGFLEDLFVNIFGYTLFPQEKYNLLTEKKNPNDSRKADAVIQKNDKIHAIIELKSAKTHISKIAGQAFGYKSQYAECRMVIVSNFVELCFYLDNAVQCEIYPLFDRDAGTVLSYERFAELYTILQKNNLLSGLPIQLKEQSIIREQELTWRFYNDYQGAKAAFYKNMALNNRQTDKLLLFEKAQKLLDRIVFVCFAQYKGLLPANHVVTIIKEWETLKKLQVKQDLYARLRIHFGYIDQGFENELYEIFAYNGGLFAQDEVLEKVKLDDAVLETHCRILSKYNFRDDIDVNVLGYIFEHSLNELEEKREELVNEKTPTTKRKEDGIFYTPLLITDYMLEETLGKLCADKQKELDFEKLNLEKIQSYRNWLLGLRILDPSCGSGAFLNQVLTFLLKEHQQLNLLEKGFSKKIKEKDFAYQILENNIFGVDINLESVEITKLSLWLRIAEGKRKLNDLSENIKMGNSLIDDPEVDPKAFNWKKQFPKVFEKTYKVSENLIGLGAFDLILGNPPWGATISKEREIFIKNSLQIKQTLDSSEYFILKISRLLKPNARFSFVVPKSILFYSNWELSRQFILSKHLKLLCDVGLAFPEVNLEAIVFCIDNHTVKNQFVQIDRFEPLKKVNIKKDLVPLNPINQDLMQENNILILTDINPISRQIIDKIWAKNSYLQNFERQVFRGLYIPDAEKEKILGKGETLFVNKVPDVDAYQFKKIMKIDLDLSSKNYSHKLNLLSVDRLVIKVMRGKKLKAAFAPHDILTTEKLVNLTVKDLNLKYVLAILNAKLTSFYLQKVLFSDTTETSRVMDDCYLNKIPLLAISEEEQTAIAQKVDIIMANYQKINTLSNKFLRIAQAEFRFEKISEKLQKWYELNWAGFQNELNRLKTPIPLKRQLEWIDLFEDQQKTALNFANEIQTLENQLDQMVFDLYGLSVEEREMMVA